MTTSLNRVQLIGHLGADPEIRTTQKGHEVASLRIATNESFLKDGEKQEHTEWHRVVIFGDGLITKVVKPYLGKGNRVFVEGSIRSNKYTDNEGVKRYSTDIVVQQLNLLDRKPTEDRK